MPMRAVTLVEFSDFQCPFCSRFSQILSEVLRSEKDDVRVVFHPYAALNSFLGACGCRRRGLCPDAEQRSVLELS